VLVVALGGLYPMVQMMWSTNTSWSYYTPILAIVSSAVVLGEMTWRMAARASRSCPVVPRRLQRPRPEADLPTPLTPSPSPAVLSLCGRHRTVRVYGTGLSGLHAAVKFGTRHWVWEALQLILSLVSCISYIIYTYTGERGRR
jgi:hypothetical protein